MNLLNSSVRRNITIIPESFNVTTVLNSLDQLFGTILRVFKCASHEYFEGYKDEDSLVKRAINTSEVPAIASKLLSLVTTPAMNKTEKKFIALSPFLLSPLIP